MKKVYFLVLFDGNNPGFVLPIRCYSSICVANQAKNRYLAIFGDNAYSCKVIHCKVENTPVL